MSTGLKGQLGLGEPKAAGSTEQADKFKAAFQAAASAINADLQYTAAYAEKAKHDPMAAKRDKSCEAYQVALGRIDPTNPAVAQGAIDQVLSSVNTLKTSVTKLKADTEKAYNAWTAMQPTLESITDKTTEMVEWGHAKAAPLQQVLQGINDKANNRSWDEATQALTQLEGKFTPIYEDYQRQKAAQAEYEPALAALQPRLDAVKACTFAQLSADVQSASSAEGPMQASADSKDYVKALEQLKTLETSVTTLEAKITEIEAQKKQYEDARAQLDPKLQEASTSTFKVLVDLETQIGSKTAEVDQAAADEQYEQANTLLGELTSMVDEKLQRVVELEAQKAEYETLKSTLTPRLDAALSSCSGLQKSLQLQQELTQAKTDMEAAATEEDFVKATELGGQIGPKLDELEKLEKQKQEYDERWAAVQPDVQEYGASQANKTYLQPLQSEMATLQTEMESAAQAEEYETALTTLASIEQKINEIKQLIEEKKAAWQAADASMRAKLDDALVSARAYPSLKGDRSSLTADQTTYDTEVKGEDYEKLATLAKDLEGKASAYLTKATAEQAKFDKLGADAMKAMDDAGYFSRDDVAREWAGKLQKEVVDPGPPPVTAISFLPSDVRNRMMEELQDGVFSDEDKFAMKKLVGEPYLDPEFEKIDKANRAKMIEKLKTDPAFKHARDNWDTLKPEERIAIMQKAVDYQADAYGIPKTTIATYTENNAKDFGYYDHDDGKLYVNNHDAALKGGGFDEAIDTAVHENGHRQQSTMIDQLESGEIYPGHPLYNQAMTFKLNDTKHGYYVQPPKSKGVAPIDKGPEYFTQPQENHSRITGGAVQKAKIGT